MDNIEFREATLGDIDTIIDFSWRLCKFESNLVSHFNPEYYLSDQFKELLTNQIASENSKYTLAYFGDRPVGLMEAGLKENYPFRNLTKASLLQIFVLEEYRNRGIGKQFLRLMEEWAKAKGMKSIELNIATNNPDADRFYESLGYKDWEKAKEKLI